MSKKLAIKGHPTRGREVIEILEMMGGKNTYGYTGDMESLYFSIYDDTIIYGSDRSFLNDNYVFFTLEEFLEKYPFKVGDKVIDDSGEDGIIIEMKWDEEVLYKVDFGKECYYFTSDYLRPYKEISINLSNGKCERTHEDVIFDSIIWHLRNSINNGKQNLSGGECEAYFRKVVKKNNENKMKTVLAELLDHIKNTSKEELEKEFNELEEWSNVGPTVEEFMDFCNKVNKKPKYPTTYDECCIVMYGGVADTYGKCIININDGYKGSLIQSFQRLIFYRDSYRKIAGEQMGLGKPWEPSWQKTEERKFCIIRRNDNVVTKWETKTIVRFLAFPTEEMRDAFYENFKDLIEQCKELL